MNLKILAMLLIYYFIIGAVLLLGGSTFDEYDYNFSQLNNSELTSQEIDRGGLFNTGVSFTRFFGLVTIGLGLPDDTPSWFQVMFSLWQTFVLIFTVAFIISSIWNG